MGSRRLHVSSGQLDGGAVDISGPAHHYLFRVLRLAVGDAVVLFDGQGREADARVEQVTAASARLAIETRREAEPAVRPRLVALVSLIKGERMEWGIQKLVELGVDEIIPIAAARSVVKLAPERAEARRQRYQAIAADAARQCGRATVPEIAAIGDLGSALLRLDPGSLRLVLVTRDGQPLGQALSEGAGCDSLAFAIGPEGGFEAAELELLQQSGFFPLSLGPRVLRAETAAIAAAALLGFVLGDLG